MPAGDGRGRGQCRVVGKAGCLHLVRPWSGGGGGASGVARVVGRGAGGVLEWMIYPTHLDGNDNDQHRTRHGAF